MTSREVNWNIVESEVLRLLDKKARTEEEESILQGLIALLNALARR